MPDHHAHPPDRLDDATIVRYLSGTCERAEVARVERWLAADPAHRAEMAALQAAWHRPAAAAAEADPDDRMWQWLAARLDEPAVPPAAVPTLQLPRRSRSSIRSFGLIAAALMLIVGGALLLPRLSERSSRLSLNAPLASAGVQELIAPRGARITGNLPDGSRVILAPESRLVIPAAFAATHGARDVYLQSGEAFFEVTHDATRPFRVHTAHGIAEDLGTAFTVTAYPETRAMRTVVASGVVALRRKTGTNDSVTLRAGDLGLIDATGAVTLRRSVDVAAYIGWTQGQLAFDDVPLSEALATIGRWYDVQLRTADTSLTHRRFTAAFHDEPLVQVLRVLEVALDVRAERRGQLVILQPRH